MWTKVSKQHKKPLRWWYHKMMCDIGYKFAGSTSNMYYKHLRALCEKGFNIYGERI